MPFVFCVIHGNRSNEKLGLITVTHDSTLAMSGWPGITAEVVPKILVSYPSRTVRATQVPPGFWLALVSVEVAAG